MSFKISKASIFFNTSANLGEGPLWLNNSNKLFWVDINKGEVHATDLKTKEDKIIFQGEKTSCILPISEIEFIIADTDKLIKLNTLTAESHTLLTVDFKTPNIRFNDGKVDPNGNLWIGTMEMEAKPYFGSLYRIDRTGKVDEVLKNITISNGLAWSIDEKTMYYIDTFEQVIYAFDFNKRSVISNRRVIIKISKELGAADGMTIDSNGNLWIALWGGFSVVCYNPSSGEMIEKVKVLAPNVTSCTFGGKEMDILFITTAREGLTRKELKKYPNSGSVFASKTNVNGIISVNYKPWF